MYRILIALLKIVMGRYFVFGMENIANNSSAVFVCNHAKVYGPMAMWLFFPLKFRPWVIYRVMTAGLCRKHLEKDLFSNCHGFLKQVCRLAAFIIEPACLWVMRKVKAIPVYRGKNKIFITFRQSVDALSEGWNIVIFPEKEEAPYQGDLRDIYTGFVHLARKYYNEKGKVLAFYPVYIDIEGRSINVGRPVMYNPQAVFMNERIRLSHVIMETIRQFSTPHV